MRRIAIETFIKRALDKHSGKYDYSLIQNELTGQDTVVDIVCPIHGIFQNTVRMHLRGTGCPECGKISRRIKVSTARNKQETSDRKQSRLNNEKNNFIQKSNNVHQDFYDYSIVDYQGCSVPVTIICPVHGKFKQKPVLHLQGKGCRSCKIDKRKLSINGLIQRFRKIHGNKYDYSLVTEYKNNRTLLTIVCPEHGEFTQPAYSHLQGIGCPKCGNIKKGLTQRWTTATFTKKANKIHDNKYDYSKVEYITAMLPVIIICPTHGEFIQKPYQHMIGEGCPKCAHQESKGEKEIAEWLRDNGYNVLQRVKGIVSSVSELDIYLPDNKLAIEFNGLYWHSSRTGRSPSRHLDKLRMCESKGIRLIQLWDCEWYNKKDICKEIILFALGRIDQRLFARNCIVKEVSLMEANNFLEENHIQGKCASAFHVGLFFKNELVGVQCFQSPNEGGTGRDAWLIARTSFKKGVQVIGGISKMFRYFIKNVSPDKVIDYTDRRLFTASGHYAMGFERVGVTKICNYLTDGKHLFSRRHYRHMGKRHFRNKMPWDDTLSDTENLANNGWYWVWDCGKIKNVWKRAN
jgi:hypothetical protein